MQKKKKTYRKSRLSIIAMSLVFFWTFGYIAIAPYTEAENFPIQTETTASPSQKAQKEAINKIINFINQSKENYATNFDFISDASLQKYISKAYPLQNIAYTPADLQTIDSELIETNLTNPQLRAPARAAFEQMATDFYDHFDQKLVLYSAYRSYELQKSLISNGCSLQQCAEPGTSEHQLWLAVDIHIMGNNGTFKLNQKNNKYYAWLDENAHKYGFHNTFKRGLHTDGESKIKEYRHRRYCSIPVATFLYENNLTLGEYVELQKNPVIPSNVEESL